MKMTHNIVFITIIIFLLIFIAVYFYSIRNFKYWKVRNVPYQTPLFLFGNLVDVVLGRETIQQCLHKLYNEFEGPYFGFYGMDKPFLVVKSPNIIKQILVTNFDAFCDKAYFNNEDKEPLFSNSLLGIKCPKWQVLRAKMAPVFALGRTKQMLPLIDTCAENMCRYIEGKTDQEVETKVLATKFNTDVIASCAFGIDANSFASEDSPFIKAENKVFVGVIFRRIQSLSYVFAHTLVRIFQMRFIPIEAANFLREVFVQTMKHRQITKIPRKDLIDALIDLRDQHPKDSNISFSGDALAAQAVTFYLAATETSSCAVAFTFLELATHPNIQETLRKEVLQTTKTYGGLTYEAIQSMKYLHMVVSETFRKYAITPFIHRRCTKDTILNDTGFKVDCGLGILIPFQELHLDPQYFPEPEKYDPDRFSAGNKSNIVPYTYLPFGFGPRNCIGNLFGLLQTKLGIVRVLMSYKIEPTINTNYPLIFMQAYYATQPKGGVPLLFKKL